MKLLFSSLLFFCFSICMQAQKNHPDVKLVAEENGKRLNLFAENSSDKKYVVFLRVVTSDYRRSGNRPILTEIEPQTKIKLITLIKLAGTEGNYDATFIVNNAKHDINIKKDVTDFDIKIDDGLNNLSMFLFTKTNCDLCDETKAVFDKNNLNYKEYFATDTKRLDSVLTKHKKTKNTFPLLIIGDSLYNNLTSTKQVIDAINSHRKK
ncbi:MAG: glutaredoxin domain-containing protein [Oceanihabitans sp.]